MQYLLFPSVKAREPSRRLNHPWHKFAAALIAGRRIVAHKEAVPLIGPFTLRAGTTRRKDNVATVNILFVDVDDGTPPHDATKRLRDDGIAHAVYSTHSSTTVHPKYRIVAPLARPVPGDQWRAIYERICRAYGLPFDPKTTDPSRIFYLPSTPPEAAEAAFAWKVDGRPLDPEALPAGTTQGRGTTQGPTSAFDPFPSDADTEPFKLPPKIDRGERNDTLHRYAWHLLAKDDELAYGDLLEKLLEANRKRCVPPLPETEVRAIADSAVSHFERRARDDAASEQSAADDGEFENPPQYPAPTERYMYELNKEYAYIKAQSAVWKMDVRAFASPEKCKHDQSNVLLPASNRKNAKLENAFDLWMKWRYRRQYRAIEYAPGEPETTASGALNLWSGWPQEPRPGDVSLWHRLMDHIFGDAEKERRWFEQWCAYPIQHPGAKLLSAVILWSAVEGSGKSSVGLLLRALYGERHSRTIDGSDLESKYNSWTKDTSFILGEEVRSEDSRIDADRLKHLITGETVSVELKYVDRFELPNRMNFLFTSNHPAAFFLTEHSRRYFVWEIKSGKLPLELGKALERWRKSEEGRAALMHYFLQLDTSDFEPNADAPDTESKRTMIEAGRSDLERWLDENVGGDAVFRLDDLKQRYYDEGGGRASTKPILNYLRRRHPQMTQKKVRVNGQQRHLWALRADWANRPESEWASAYLSWLEGALLKR